MFNVVRPLKRIRSWMIVPQNDYGVMKNIGYFIRIEKLSSIRMLAIFKCIDTILWSRCKMKPTWCLLELNVSDRNTVFANSVSRVECAYSNCYLR